MIKTILFICTGNTCRSAMAEGLFKKLLSQKKDVTKRFKVRSAGIYALPGLSATPEAVKVMAELGVDIKQHLTTQVDGDQIKKADLILVMSNTHKDFLTTKYNFAQDKIYLLKYFARIDKFSGKLKTDENDEIIDPLGRSIEFYRTIAKQLKDNLEKILHKISVDNNN